MSTSFPSFTKLPAELRSMVWAYALPEPRVFEVLDTPHSNLKTPASAGLTFANSTHEPPPVLAAVCRESRAFVLRQYRPLTLSGTTKYIDPIRDIVLLEPYLLIRRLLRALQFLAQVDFMRNNMRQVALGTSYGFATGIFHPILSGKVSKNNMNMFLRKFAQFPRLKKVLFVVHEEFQCSHPKPPVMEWPYGLQLFHHNYSFKVDDELEISYHNPWHFHRNVFQYYPLRSEDATQDEIDMGESGTDEEEEDEIELNRKPTNEDWRRFKRRFLKAVHSTLTKRLRGQPRLEPLVLQIEGASLLWKYKSY
ncbi:hypothetical protein FALBO_15065 [Fusarium albosuccineum]|uniref:2EXR domain-containing protein n=1 Tax=Fusarium albosuccineum TaxID=1237068 RepID=A0A8H4KY11_9HYPO|nr:hypothetical protein FALBO_15065 [Fusarium albosuccineum]